MRLDVAASPGPGPAPEGIAIREVSEDVDWDAADLPNHDADLGLRFGALTRQDPASAIFAAFEGDAVVGKVVVHVTGAADLARRGIATTAAGIHDCGVVPAARRRGVGGALTAAAVARAGDLGCRMVVLNATPL